MIEMKVSSCPEVEAFPWDTVNALGPHLIWIAFFAVLLMVIGPERLISLFENMQKLSVAGIEIEFRSDIKHASEKRNDEARDTNHAISDADIGRASRRLAVSQSLTNGARILWVDDHPRNNVYEASAFEKAGAQVRFVTSTEEANRALAQESFHVVISDIGRGSDNEAGLKFVADLRKRRFAPPAILYTGRAGGPVPQGAFGLTNRPDDLIHLVLDALARTRG